MQPLSKCVVLSVFAHVLLFLFAYGTRLLEVPKPVGGDEAIQLSFVATDRPPRDGDEKSEPNPWEEFLPGEATEPEAAQSQRLNVDGDPGRLVRSGGLVVSGSGRDSAGRSS